MFSPIASRDRRHSGSAMVGAQREPLSQKQIMAQRVLTTGFDAEVALADALVSVLKHMSLFSLIHDHRSMR